MVRTKVFVGNLSFQTQEAELAAEFGTAGKVISANIITRGPRSLGYGFVEMDSEEDAHNAVKLMSKKEINGREINVEIAKPQDESKVRQPRPKEEEGEDARRRRPRRRPKKDTEEGGAQPSQKKESREGEGEGSDEARKPRNRKRKPAAAPGQKKVEPEENREESKTTLFVANLPFSLDDDGFAKVVSDLGLKLKVAHVVKKRNGRSKGYGFVEFENQEDQQKALAALNKKVIEERELSVKIALTEIRRDEQQEEKKEASKPAEKKAAPAEKKAAPAEKKAAPSEKKAAPAEKKSSPAPAEKKSAPAEKKSSPAPVEKKASAPAQTGGAPAEKKAAAPAEKKSAPAEKKTATPEKKDEKK